MIFKGSLPHKKKWWNLIIDPVLVLQSNRGYFAIPLTGAILPPLQNGHQSFVFGPIWKRTFAEAAKNDRFFLALNIFNFINIIHNKCWTEMLIWLF